MNIKYSRLNLEVAADAIKSNIQKLGSAKKADEAFHGFEEFCEIIKEYESNKAVCSLKIKQNIKDNFYLEEQNYYNSNKSIISDAINLYYKAIFDSPFNKDFEKKYGSLLLHKIENSLKGSNRASLKFSSLERELVQEYQKFITEYHQMNSFSFSENNRLLNSNSRDLRIKGVQFKGQVFYGSKERIEKIFTRLILYRNKQADALKMKSYSELSSLKLMRFDYTREDIGRLRNIIAKEVVPLLNYFQLRDAEKVAADKIGICDDKYFYTNFNYNNGGINKLIYDVQKILSYTSRTIGDYFSYLAENNLLDLEPRTNKAQGGSSHYIIKAHIPYVFANLSGLPSDFRILIHELGHSYAAFKADKNNINPVLFYPGLETCEIHSTGLELFACNHFQIAFGDNADRYLYGKLKESLYLLSYGCQVDEFQEIVYGLPKVDFSEINNIWLKLDSKYRPWLSYADLPFYSSGAGWQEQRHIIGSPFYFIDYVIAQISAFELFIEYNDNPEKSLHKYFQLIDYAGTLRYRELIEQCGLSSVFDENNVHSIMSKINSIMISLAK